MEWRIFFSLSLLNASRNPMLILLLISFCNNLGMTKEVSNLIKENNELLETKYVKIE
jgi:hypothetical protein